MGDSQNCQPELPSWNLMGMMNNNWFRVKVHDVPNGNEIWFEHPTRVEPNLAHYWDKENSKKTLHLAQDGNLASPGWMERLKDLVVKAHAPLPIEEQPLDGDEHIARITDIKLGEAGASGKATMPKKVRAPETINLCPEAMSGDGTLENVGIKLDGKFKSPVTNQCFDTDLAQKMHY